MKVKCINNTSHQVPCLGYIKQYYHPITINEIYNVVKETETHYFVKNDEGYTTNYPKQCFEIIKTISLTLDTTTLQAQLSQAIHHLEELNRILGELGIGIEDIKVIRND